MIYVTTARYIDQYKIYLKFNDNREGIIDLEDTITNDHRKIFNALKNIEQFKKFKVAMDTVVWENGLDLAPEFLYSKLKF